MVVEGILAEGVRCCNVGGECYLNNSTGWLLAALTMVQLEKGERVSARVGREVQCVCRTKAVGLAGGVIRYQTSCRIITTSGLGIILIPVTSIGFPSYLVHG